MPYNCKSFVLRIVTWSYNCLLKIIISYLKQYVYKQMIMLYSRSGDFNNNSTDTNETLSYKYISHFILEKDP